MIDDLVSLKAASIRRCDSRVREEYQRKPVTFAVDPPARDAAILNSLRSCNASLDTSQYLIERELRRACKILMCMPTLARGHASRPFPLLDAKRPKLGFPRWSAGAIKTDSW